MSTLLAELEAAGAPAEPTLPEPTLLAVFTDQGDVVEITFGGRSVRLRKQVGLKYLAELLLHPRRPFASVELAFGSTTSTRSERLCWSQSSR